MYRGLLLLGFSCLAMSAEAQSSYCGNGVVEAGEFCDDGNLINDDNCASNCLFGAPPQYAPPPPKDPYVSSSYPLISPGGAFGLSLVSTWLLGGITPSLGHMYAADYKRAFTSYGIRAAGWVSLLAGIGLAFNASFNNSAVFGDGTGLLVLGGGAVLGTMVFDLVDAPLAAIRANQKGKRPWEYGVAPSAMPALGGGMSLQIRF
jgi:cysteine-rich repeat protein